MINFTISIIILLQMMKKVNGFYIIRKSVGAILLMLPLFLLSSCFTGVESTKKITLSKKDLAYIASTEEENYLNDIKIPNISQWVKGKKFEVADDKINIILEHAPEAVLKAGDIIDFVDIEERLSADGNKALAISFEKNGNIFKYPVEKIDRTDLDKLTSGDLPLLIELDIVDQIKTKLQGKTLWTRNNLWYDRNLNVFKGNKFVPVRITDVYPGNSFFPIKIEFEDPQSRVSYLLMNITYNTKETRPFAKLFLLNDPRKDYKSITDENWDAIQKGLIKMGMTKEEVRLSLGNPADTYSGHDYSKTMDMWYYPEGTFVRFIDDLVVDFRK